MSFHSFIGLTLPRTETSRSRRNSISETERRADFPPRHGQRAPEKRCPKTKPSRKGTSRRIRPLSGNRNETAKSGKKEKTVSRSQTRKRVRTSDALSRIWPGRAGKPRYSLIRSLYSRVRLSTRIFSPVWMNSGTRIVAPVSTVAGFSEFVEAVSPLTPGSGTGSPPCR